MCDLGPQKLPKSIAAIKAEVNQVRATFERNWEMREVKVRRDELLEKIKINREKHIKEYKEACEGYRQQALAKIEEVTQKLRQKFETLKEGEYIQLAAITFGLDVPESHEKDYDQVIMMLEMSIDNEINLKSDEFACYVMDDWDWQTTWKMSNSKYLSK
jgi:hypothetical protein